MSLIRRPFNYVYYNATVIIIGINALVFVGQRFFPNLTGFLSMNPIMVLRGNVWQFVTYMFAHESFQHILFNMFALFVFGFHLERYMGSREFLLYYLLTGLLAGIFSFMVFLLTGAYQTYLLGASGAIFAVQFAYACFFPDNKLYIWGILPVRAWLLVLIFTGIELFSSVFGVADGVAHLTHLAGFAFGWLYFLVRFGTNPWRLMRRRP